MSKPLGNPPPAKTYRGHLALTLRELALAKFDNSAVKFVEALTNAGLPLDRSNVYHWLSGKRYPDVEHLRKIAEVLECDLGTLIPECPARFRKTIGQGRSRKGVRSAE